MVSGIAVLGQRNRRAERLAFYWLLVGMLDGLF